jgi:uncharacterized membrane protein YkvA (DUF1232 family)
MYKWRKMGDIKDFSDFVIKPGANSCKIATTLILHFFSAKKKKKKKKKPYILVIIIYFISN